MESLSILRVETFELNDRIILGKSSFPAWLSAVSRHVRSLQLLLPVVKGTSLNGGVDQIGYELRPTDRLLSLPRSEGFIRGYLNFFALAVGLVQARSRSSAILCRAPEHLNLLAIPLAAALGFRVFIWVVHDRDETIASQMSRRSGALFRAGVAVSRLTGKVEDWCYKNAAGVIVNGSAMHKKIAALTGQSNTINVISSTISIDHLPSLPPNRLGRAETVTRLLYVGRLANEKGLGDLLEAVAHLDGAGVRVSLAVAGWSSHGEADRLEADIAALGIGSLVEMIGPVAFGPALFELYAKADIFVLPSWAEGTPRVLVEAMGFGLPVVATAVGGVPDLMEDTTNGILVPPREPLALADGLRRLIADPILCRSISAANYDKARLYTVEALAAKMVKFIHERSSIAVNTNGGTSA